MNFRHQLSAANRTKNKSASAGVTMIERLEGRQLMSASPAPIANFSVGLQLSGASSIHSIITVNSGK